MTHKLCYISIFYYGKRNFMLFLFYFLSLLMSIIFEKNKKHNQFYFIYHLILIYNPRINWVKSKRRVQEALHVYCCQRMRGKRNPAFFRSVSLTTRLALSNLNKVYIGSRSQQQVFADDHIDSFFLLQRIPWLSMMQGLSISF